MNAQKLAFNLENKYSHYLLSLPETQLRQRLENALRQLTWYTSLAESEIYHEHPVFGCILYEHLVNVGIAEQTDGAMRLTQRGKDLLFIIANYLDATIAEETPHD